MVSGKNSPSEDQRLKEDLEAPTNGSLEPIRNPTQKSSFVQDLRWVFSSLGYFNFLLLCIPVGISVAALKLNSAVVFVINCLAIIPLAKAMGIATEELSLRTNQTVGGLLNATFGNAVELIMSILALKDNLITVVQSSLLGSILSNLLLVLGACFVAGGLKFKIQSFNLIGAQTSASILALSSMSLIIPSAFYATLHKNENSPAATLLNSNEHSPSDSDDLGKSDLLALSRITALILLLVYILYIVFQLKTHREYFEDEEETFESGHDDNHEAEEETETPSIMMATALGLLFVSTIFVAICAEYLVSSIEEVSKSMKMSEIFIGLIILPIVGNAAEHVSAITFAMKDKMSLALGIAIGSSSQIALFVTPLMVVVGWMMGKDMTLDFHPFQTIICFVAIVMVNYLIQDGKSNWLEGVMLISTYFIIGTAFFLFQE